MLIGAHEARFITPNLVVAVLRGDVSESEARQLSELFAQWTQGIDCRFLIDLRKLGYVGAEAREQFAKEHCERPAERDHKVELTFIGATLRTKVLAAVVVTARSMISNARVRTQYFGQADEAAAWAGIDAALLG
jgi:hypothetical protein